MKFKSLFAAGIFSVTLMSCSTPSGVRHVAQDDISVINGEPAIDNSRNFKSMTLKKDITMATAFSHGYTMSGIRMTSTEDSFCSLVVRPFSDESTADTKPIVVPSGTQFALLQGTSPFEQNSSCFENSYRMRECRFMIQGENKSLGLEAAVTCSVYRPVKPVGEKTVGTRFSNFIDLR